MYGTNDMNDNRRVNAFILGGIILLIVLVCI